MLQKRPVKITKYLGLDIIIKLKSTTNLYMCAILNVLNCLGWSGGAMVLGKLPVPGRPTNLDWRRARAYCVCSRCGWGLFGHFFSRLPFLFFLPLSGRRPDID